MLTPARESCKRRGNPHQKGNPPMTHAWNKELKAVRFFRVTFWEHSKEMSTNVVKQTDLLLSQQGTNSYPSRHWNQNAKPRVYTTIEPSEKYRDGEDKGDLYNAVNTWLATCVKRKGVRLGPGVASWTRGRQQSVVHQWIITWHHRPVVSGYIIPLLHGGRPELACLAGKPTLQFYA